jgi:hypothetical protein
VTGGGGYSCEIAVQQIWRLLIKTNISSVEETTPLANCRGTNINSVLGPDGAVNQERLYWRGPAAIHGTGLVTAAENRRGVRVAVMG